MERKFYSEDFEDLLKESADDFKMIPSKKVWHGIYNDLHPGRRWPSIGMSLIFIFTLILVGHLNTQQGHHTYFADVKKTTQIQKNTLVNNNNTSAPNTTLKNNFSKRGNQFTSKINPTQNINNSTHNIITSDKNEGNENIVGVNPPTIYAENNKEQSSVATLNKVDLDESSKNIYLNSEILSNTNLVKVNAKIAEPAINTVVVKPTVTKNDKNTSNEVNSIAAQTETIHLPFFKIHKNSKTNLAFYVSPTISYRNFSGSISNGSATSTNADLNKSVKHDVAPGFEAGTVLKYTISKKLKFTTGLQFNYSAYTIRANSIHPTNATLMLYDQTNSPYQISTISYFGNGSGAGLMNLHNYSLQLSLPVGFEYVLAGNDKMQLNAAASLQPSWVIANQAYLLSTDKLDYLSQASLSRKWNMSTNIGTFLSFNSNKFAWQIGPQVHYQLLSSYTHDYRVKEHFIDYGIRLAISKIAK